MTFHTLVSVEQLSAQLDNPSWRVFDCRHDLADTAAGERAYRAGHVPRAQFLHLDGDLSGPKTGSNGRHPLPAAETLATKLAQCGVSNDSQIVAYDDGSGMFASRLWWLARWLGHDRVAVLDGGLQAWRRAGGALTELVTPIAPAIFRWRVNDATVDVAALQTRLGQPELLLVDARAADRFRGENETIDPIAGRIPGAINRPYGDNLTTDGGFKQRAQLRQEFDALLGKRSPDSIVNYCGSGVSACHNLLAMEVAGLSGSRLYPGSWSEWCANPKRPMATGAD